MQGLCIRLARVLNALADRSGRAFADRYHSLPLPTPTQVKNSLRYVLQNARKHAARQGVRFSPRWLDPYSSAVFFDGWAEPASPPPGETRPIAAARSWLLRIGWRRLGLLRRDELPASA